MTVQVESYEHFSRLLHGKVIEQRIPVTATIEVSHRCSLNCSHCYNNLPMNDETARRNELSFEELCRVMDEMADAGVLWLLFSGGEIFARSDFLEVYAYAKKKGFLITLFTNGTLITERVADYLAKWRPFAIEITLYGRTRETYEKLTRVPGSWEKCMRGIDLLLERKLPLKLKTVAVSINKHEIFAIQDFAAELGIECRFDSMINPRTDCSASPLHVRLTPAEIVELDVLDGRRAAEWREFAERTIRYAEEDPHPDRVYHCSGGVNSFSVDPAGKMTICVLSHFDEYDLRRGSLRDGWDHFLQDVRAKPTTRPTKCTDCRIKAVCGMCPANGELENGDPEEPVDFLCQTAHLRAEVFGFAVAAHGDCAYCEGGEHHNAMVATAASLRERKPVTSALPVAATKSVGCDTGCFGCGNTAKTV